MTTIAFILGILLGIGLAYWERSRFNRQLKRMLSTLSDTTDLIHSLPVLSLVRRELSYLYQQRQQLQKTIDDQKVILDLAPIGYLLLDGDNQLLWCNAVARELLRIDRWQPGHIRLLLELVRSYELDQLIEQTRSSQISQVREWTFYPSQYATKNHLNEDQTPKLYQTSVALKASSFPLANGQVGVFLENQQPLVELSRSRDRAFSDLTHELRTPLTSISLLAEALQKRLQNPERRWVEQMLKEIERLMKLVQDWLEISQLQEDPSQSLHYQTLDLKELMDSAWATLTPLARQKSITFSYSGPEHLPLEGDQERLTQVFVNLFDNAIKHSPDHSPILVEVMTPDTASTTQSAALLEKVIMIDIIDCGEGFLESDLPYVFDRLYRGEPSRARKTSEPDSSRHGSGLGLAIVQQIIQAHGGSVQAKNSPETGGAWMQIKLLKEPPASERASG
ncbi:sensor histidine kinase [Gloeothece verrucosa]|uniref:histidine kinase n=1 Tax=Gloeothece verrucosa (strain PCC 7822) TaxID=497965 RepID=E0UAS6_GLOV7|nr:HAMP domain-containing sensor histidine kinase [Gloeothece verrucosa]ADN13928.1 PAS/PAC sensor signal transduction histidine kinase [Gloeothece verrucosa PCC 7822]